MKTIKVSYKAFNCLFNVCGLSFIHNRCHGYCCSSKSMPPAVLDEDIKNITNLGGIVKDNILLMTGDNRCPMQLDNGLCKLYTKDGDFRPYDCKKTPIIITKRGTVSIYFTFYSRKCRVSKFEEKVPAYIAFKDSLIAFLGSKELYDKCVKHFKENKTDFIITVTDELRTHLRKDSTSKMFRNRYHNKENIKEKNVNGLSRFGI